MTDSYRSADDVGERSTTDTAKDEASRVAQDAKARGGDVAQTARAEARNVTDDARYQARELFGQARDEAYQQSGVQQKRLAEGLHGAAEELDAMVRGSRDSGAPSGPATQLSAVAAEQIGNAATWLERREPADVLHEVRRFARRNPGTFLAGAALLGLVAGRLTRSLTDDARSGNDQPRRVSYNDESRRVSYNERQGSLAPRYDRDTTSTSDYGTHNVDSVAPSMADPHSEESRNEGLR